MNLSQKQIIIISISIVIAVSLTAFFIMNKDKSPEKNRFRVDLPDRQSLKNEAYIYFTDNENSFLKAEKRKVIFNTNTRKYANDLILMLLRGPGQENLVSPIPKNTELLSLYIDENKTAVLDFSGEIRENHPGGSQAEILTIYSVVNTLTLNIEDIKSVKILINGNEADTLAGHIALRFPLKENLTIVQ